MTLIVYLMIGAVLSGLAAGELVKKWSAPTCWDAPSQLAEGSSPGVPRAAISTPNKMSVRFSVQIVEICLKPSHSLSLSLPENS